VNIKKIRPQLDKRLPLVSKILLAYFPIVFWHYKKQTCQDKETTKIQFFFLETTLDLV